MSDTVTLARLSTLPVEGRFSTLDTVTIKIYDSLTGLGVPTDSAACTEVLTTGFFVWNFSNLTTQPSVESRYFWIMTNGSIEQSDYVMVGGYVELIGGSPLPVGLCEIYAHLFTPEDEAIETNDVYFDTSSTYAQVQGVFTVGTKIFSNKKILPSFDQSTGRAFWRLPIGANIKFYVKQLNVNQVVVVPDQEVVDLASLLV